MRSKKGYIDEMIQQPIDNVTQGKLSDTRSTNCIYDASKKCGYPNKLSTSSNPKVFIISSTEFGHTISWFKEALRDHIRTEKGAEFETAYFTDTVTFDFCNNVCIPIHESWFCLAIIKEELLPQISKRRNREFVSSFITRSNPNVFFEVGLALAWKKDIIFYIGNNQELPSDWSNLAKLVITEPSLFLSSEDNSIMMNKLREIIKLNPFIGYPVKWVEKKNE